MEGQASPCTISSHRTEDRIKTRTGLLWKPGCPPHTQLIVWQAASQELPPPCAVSRAATKLGQTGISSSQDFKDQVKGAAAAPFL